MVTEKTKTKTKKKRLLAERIKTRTIAWQKTKNKMIKTLSTPCAQLAVAPISTTELIKTQLAQYITEIQQWQND